MPTIHVTLAIAEELGCCEMSINDCLVRFTEQGTDGCQRMSLAKADMEQKLDKEFLY